MLDKFIGDAMMAAFGVPMQHDDDEDRSVRAAVSMIRSLDVWNKERIEAGKFPVEIGIGLNTDIVVSGNIGSKKRMDFTMIGDGVNLAARLETACKQYKARILVSEFTFKKLRGTYRAREVDRIIVKGKTTPVGVYEILEYHTPESFPDMMDALGSFKYASRNTAPESGMPRSPPSATPPPTTRRTACRACTSSAASSSRSSRPPANGKACG
jgi:adenylate cyclase